MTLLFCVGVVWGQYLVYFVTSPRVGLTIVAFNRCFAVAAELLESALATSPGGANLTGLRMHCIFCLSAPTLCKIGRPNHWGRYWEPRFLGLCQSCSAFLGCSPE